MEQTKKMDTFKRVKYTEQTIIMLSKEEKELLEKLWKKINQPNLNARDASINGVIQALMIIMPPALNVLLK